LAAAAQPRSLDPSKDLAAYGYGSIAWKERMESWKQKQDKLQIMKRENGDYDDDDPDLPLYVLVPTFLYSSLHN
jgi:cellulose synthase A